MYNISEGNNMIKEIYDEKLKIESADYLQEKLSNTFDRDYLDAESNQIIDKFSKFFNEKEKFIIKNIIFRKTIFLPR